MKSSVSNYESNLFISGVKVYGVNSVNFGYSLPLEHINIIGYDKFATFTSSPPQSSLSVQKYLSKNDIFLNFTGLNAISGGLYYHGKNFSFNNAYLNNYTVSCSVGNFPSLSCNFNVFGDIGTGLTNSGVSQTGALTIVRPADIKIECDGTGTNRIESFNYSVECGRQAFYTPTGTGATDVKTIRPFKVSAQFSIGVDDYESKRLFDYVIDSNKKNINITIGALATFTMSNMELIGESVNSSATDDLVMTLNYVGYV